MLIPSHLQLAPSNSRTRVPAGGIDLIASIDFESDWATTATLSSFTKVSQGDDAISSDEVATPNHSNQQYSIYAITNAAASIVERYAYTAYGQPTILNAAATVIATSAISNRYTYTAREWDATVGLHHFRARWMSGLTGRFLTRDPIGFVGSKWDLYEYVGSHPHIKVDPSGKVVFEVVTAVVIYEMIIGVGCGVWATEVHAPFARVDPGARYRHCNFNCCVNRFNAGVPIAALLGSVILDPFPFDADSQGDWFANFIGILVSYNISSSCLRNCDPFIRPCPPPVVVSPEPYVPQTRETMRELANAMCNNTCRNRAINHTSGPGPEADRIYQECYDECMGSAGY